MSARALLFVLMILTTDIVAIETRILSGPEANETATSTRIDRRRHEADSKFQQILRGAGQTEDNPIYKRRSVMADDHVQQEKHITNIDSNTLFYERNEEGTLRLNAYNKTPNESNSVFLFQSVCMDRLFLKWFSHRGCNPQSHQDGKLLKVRQQGTEYLMCANGKRVELVKSSSIQNGAQAELCVWKTFDVLNNRRFIYTKYANGCRKARRNKNCRLKRGFVVIHQRKKSRTDTTAGGKRLKVLLRYIRPPMDKADLRRFKRKNQNEFLFYLHKKNPKQFSNFRATHPFTTQRPRVHTSRLDIEEERETSRRRRKKVRNCNNLLMNSGCRRYRNRGGRRKKYRKPANLLDRQNYRSPAGLIWEHPFRHKSLLDNK